MSFLRSIYQFFYQREYRPSRLFRLPLYGFRAWFAIRAKHPFFFSAVNPAISGGFMREPKSITYSMLPIGVVPHSIVIVLPRDITNVQDMIQQAGIVFPCIIKPDGDSVRGDNVHKVVSLDHLNGLMQSLPHGHYLIQDYVGGDEYSVYYARLPWEKTGNIVGITKKVYPYIVGDGKLSLENLLQNHDRYKRYISLFRDEYGVDMNEILPFGVKKEIASIGNHCKGSLFLDDSMRATEKLSEYLDGFFTETEGVYLYRLDVKGLSRDYVSQGDFTVLEVNAGVFAEPTYIYDPSYKIINGYREFYRIRDYAYRIATYNHRVKKTPYISWQEGCKNILDFLKK